MKKRTMLLVLLALTLGIGSAFAGARRSRTRRRAPNPPAPKNCLAEIGLTEEQQVALAALRQETIEALKEAKGKQQARLIIQEFRQEVKDILTEEQLAALQECMRPEKPLTCWDQIELDPGQIEAIDAIRAAAMEAIKAAEGPRRARDIIEQMHQAVEDVLTEEQLAALRDCLRPEKPVNCMEQIGLTPEQTQAMEQIRLTAMDAVRNAVQDRDRVRQILNQMHDDMMSVLTDEQLQALEQCRNTQRHGGQGQK